MMTVGIDAPPKVWLFGEVALNTKVPLPSLKVFPAAWLKAPAISIVPLEAVNEPPVNEIPAVSVIVALLPVNVPPVWVKPPRVTAALLELKVPVPETVRPPVAVVTPALHP
jgi:hypothetical protein